MNREVNKGATESVHEICTYRNFHLNSLVWPDRTQTSLPKGEGIFSEKSRNKEMASNFREGGSSSSLGLSSASCKGYFYPSGIKKEARFAAVDLRFL
ncbi:hypothetical protein Avbf_07669, partial [Armadillidium vulgare]